MIGTEHCDYTTCTCSIKELLQFHNEVLNCEFTIFTSPELAPSQSGDGYNMYNVSESAVHFGSRSLGCGPCSVNMTVFRYEMAVLQYADSMSHDFEIHFRRLA